ncbi:MAG: hydroxylamine reductase [archaeon]|nr:hydroxylamine reductase [archaeon]
MFCFQCQETFKNTGCTKQGICGKKSNISNLQDLLIYIGKGISFWSSKIREFGISKPEINHEITRLLFTTITNVNFNQESLIKQIKRALNLRDGVKSEFLKTYLEKYGKEFSENLPDAATWHVDENIDLFINKGRETNPESIVNEDIRSLKYLVLFSLKGMAAYTDHALVLGYEKEEIWAFMQKALAQLLDEKQDADSLVKLVLETGEFGVKAMALLDEANTSTFGHQEPTNVSIGVKPGPGILISGHDLLDLKELLEQTEGKGVNIYTHGEMLAANAYPGLKKHKHLAGNYGGAWYEQKKHFDTFNGPILLTTNCLVPPSKNYIERLYTTGTVSYPNVKHISDRENGKQKDFSGIIEAALKTETPDELETGTITIGFARNTVLGAAGAIIKAVKNGAIKRFVVMGGCDGRNKSREYYTEVAQKLPKDTIILTAGCAKYRYNKLDLGKIGDFPRVLDAGQCNDCYSLAVIALELVKAFGVDSVNDLPLSFDIGWYEQKAVLVLVALLHLGVKNIRLGPTLPGFLSENVAKVIIDKFGLKGIINPEEDINSIMKGH